MSILKRYLILFFFICIFNTSSSQDIDPKKGFLLIPNDWEKIDKGWPIQDKEDSYNDENTQFYYNKKYSSYKHIVLKIKDQFIHEVKNRNSNYFKINFKLWFVAENDSVASVSLLTDESYELVDDYKLYQKLYKKYIWMPFEFVISYNNLENLKIVIRYMNENSIIAFKDFSIEYEIETKQNYEQIINQNADVNKKDVSTLNWNTYIPPVINNENYDFIFFTNNCNTECSMDISKIKIPKNRKKDNFTMITVLFEFYTIGSKETAIQIENMTYKSNANAQVWGTVDQNCSISNSSKVLIKVKTGKEEDKEFVAIRNLKIVFKNNDGKKIWSSNCENKYKCEWTGLTEASWSKTSEFLIPGQKYYYPTSNNNRLTITRSDKLNEADVCFFLTYRVSSNKNSIINIYYQNSNEGNNNLIMKIKPKIFDTLKFDDSSFCIRDIIALNAKDYSISIVAEQADFPRGVNDFILSVNAIPQTSEWNFQNSTQTFLSKFSLDTNWKDEWIQLSPNKDKVFDFTGEEFINFKAKPESDIPASAMLLSKNWILNSPTLFKNRAEYTVKLKDTKDSLRFNIKPKICDWLFRCFDVSQKRESNINKNDQKYSFDFTRQTDSTHVKLLFYIEYFANGNDKSQLEFSLILEHFGDPCHEKCSNIHECQSDPKKDPPNIKKCQEIDQCRIFKPSASPTTKDTPSGDYYCKELLSKKHKYECENFLTDYRCICADGEELNWIEKKCVKPNKNMANWSISSDYYYPNETKNKLEIELININSAKRDVCVKLYPIITDLVTLNFSYVNKSNTAELFSVQLSKDNEYLDLCVGDFLYNYEENFTLTFEVTKNISAFMTKIELYSKDLQRPPLKLIQASNIKIKPLKIISDTLNRTDPSQSEFIVNLKDQLSNTETYSGYIVTEWIDATQTFNSFDSFFQINFKRENYANFNVKQYIRFVNGIDRKYDELTLLTPIEEGKEIYRMSGLHDIKDIFKIILEFTIKIKDSINIKKDDFTIKNIIVGDSCHTYDQSSKSIKQKCNENECSAQDPTNYICACKSGQFGPNCNITEDQCNKKNGIDYYEMCKKFASVPFGGVCETVDVNKYQCKCFGKTKDCSKNNNILQRKTNYCFGNSCEFIESDTSDIKLKNITTDMIWYNKNLPEIPASDIYLRPTSNQSIAIKVKALNQSSDACINISYVLSDNAKLTFKINSFKVIDLSSIKSNYKELYSKQYDMQFEKLCVRNIFGKINGEFTIEFSPNINDAKDFFMAIKLNKDENKIIEIDSSYKEYKDLLKELPYLSFYPTTKNSDSYKNKYQWSIRFPDAIWDISAEGLIIFKVHTNEEEPHTRQAYIISQWLRKEASLHELRFKIENTDFTNFILMVVVFDEKMQEIVLKNQVLGDTDMEKTAVDDTNEFTFKIPAMNSTFRIGFKVYYKSSYESSDITFTIKNINIGDPCINNKSEVENCGGENGNFCIRKDDYIDFSCNCTKDNYKYFEHTCIEDKCNGLISNSEKGNDFCKKLDNGVSCEYQKDNPFFHCKCKTGTYWIPNANVSNSVCHKVPKCLLNNCDPIKQMCIEQNDTAVCICNGKDYVNTTEKGECVKYDPCSKDLRSARNITLKGQEPCGNSKADCVSFGLEETDYYCVCKDGFINRDDTQEFREKSKCESLICEIPFLNTCQQKCVDPDKNGSYTCDCFNDKVYKLNKNNCDPISDKCKKCENGAFCDQNEDCKCKTGYELVEKNEKFSCKPKSTIDNNICPSNNMTTTSNNELSCLCSEHYTANAKHTCDLNPICGEKGRGRIICTSKNAMCETTVNEEGIIDYKCTCPIDKQFNNDNKTNCIDKCKFDDRDTKCLNLNAICNPTLIGENENKINESKYCECRPGFVKINDTCLLATYAQKFTMSIKYDLKQPNFLSDKKNLNKVKPYDVAKYLSDLTSANKLNQEIHIKSFNSLKSFYISKYLKNYIKRIFDKLHLSINIALEKYDLNGNNFYDCFVVLTTSKPEEYEKLKTLNKTLIDNCPILNDNNKLCIIDVPYQPDLYYELPQLQITSIIVDFVKLKEISLTKYNLCDSPNVTQICPDYSKCVQDNDRNLFSCKCNEDYFAKTSEEDIKLESNKNGEFKKQRCKVRDDLCNHFCGKKNQNCTLTAPIFVDKKWTAQPLCSCAKNFTLSKDGTECIDVCTTIKCNHGTCKVKGDSGATCICNEGWYGEECDNESKASLGGWIAGIVILAVLVVVASGVAMIFARKSRAQGANHNGHTLDEYSGSSYRVGQAGQPRGQPAYSNPGFQRD